MILIIFCGAMTILAAAAMIYPIFRAPNQTYNRLENVSLIYREQLKELEREQAKEFISTNDADTARIDISRRILTSNKHYKAEVYTSTKRVRQFSAAAVLLLLPFLTYEIYLKNGRPDLASDLRWKGVFTKENNRKRLLLSRTMELAKTVKSNPRDDKNWAELGKALLILGEYNRAVIAFSEAKRLSPDNPKYLLFATEALLFVNEGRITPEIKKAILKLVELAPENPKGNYYLGLMDKQGGQLRKALNRWIILEFHLRNDPVWQKFLNSQIDNLAAALAITGPVLKKMRESALKEPKSLKSLGTHRQTHKERL